MPYNSETSQYERRATTVIDATPDGDTVAVAIDVKLDQGIDDYVADLNHHAANGRHYPATSVGSDSRFLKQSPAGVVSWADGVVAANAALKDFSNVASGAIPNAKLENEPALKDFSNVASGAIAPDKIAWTSFPSGRNLIINGDFRVNQREYASGTNTTGANHYTLDRWRVVTTGQNITFVNYLNGRQVTAPAGGIEQVIEDLNIEGGTYVLNWDGTATATVNGTSRTRGESFTLPEKTNVTVKFIGGTVARVQLEKGTIITPFEQRSIEIEFSLCQRYFEVLPTCGIIGSAASTSAYVGGFINFNTRKRAAPTLVVEAAQENVNLNTSLLNSISEQGFRYYGTASAPGNVVLTRRVTASCEL